MPASTATDRAIKRHFSALKQDTEKLTLSNDVDPEHEYIQFMNALVNAIETGTGDEMYRIHARVNGRLILQQFDFVVKK